VKRREFISLIGGAALACPLAARAQQTDHLPDVGVLMSGADDDPEGKAWYSALVQGLAALGWADNRNFHLVTRWAAGDPDRLKAFAEEMVDRKPEVIVTTGTVSLLAVSQRTSSIPIVFAQVTDPVGSGLVASLAHPGGNITGFTNFEYAIASKWVELLRELVPQISRVAVIMNPGNSGHPGYLRMAETAANAASIAVSTAKVRDAADIERTVDAFAPGPDAGLIVLPDVIAVVQRDLGRGLISVQPYPD
jgi:putative tryptophan/tyrosine transport system substrate-binding protein